MSASKTRKAIHHSTARAIARKAAVAVLTMDHGTRHAKTGTRMAIMVEHKGAEIELGGRCLQSVESEIYKQLIAKP